MSTIERPASGHHRRLTDVDRAVIDDETDGFVRVHHERGVLRGCTIVARHAGEMIGEAVYAMTHGGTLLALGHRPPIPRRARHSARQEMPSAARA